MPPLSNHRHERFSRLVVSGVTAEAAYRECGYSPNRSSAARLLGSTDVLYRVRELQETAADTAKSAVSKEWVIERLVTVVDRSMRADKAYDGAVAVKALELIGRHLGMFGAPRED